MTEPRDPDDFPPEARLVLPGDIASASRSCLAMLLMLAALILLLLAALLVSWLA